MTFHPTKRIWRSFYPSAGVMMCLVMLATGSHSQSRNSETPKTHWAFLPLPPSRAPQPKPQRSAQNPVDAFVIAALRAKGLSLSRPASRQKLIRRVYFDMIGLPPTPDEIEAFVKDSDPRAYEKLVDRLLASPHFGERWGRHWLDLARYADSDGMEGDQDRPNAFPYRDFVIRSINDDLPYDTFVRWQLAGDEYDQDNPLATAATGFITAGTYAVLPPNLLEEERIRERYNELDGIVSTTGLALLGLTLGCARCHDHKYDPVSTQEYYQLSAAFNSGKRGEAPLIPRAEADKLWAVERQWKGKLESARKAKDEAAIKALEAVRPRQVPTAYGFVDQGPAPAESWILDRGDFHLRKAPAHLGFLSVMTRGRQVSEYWSQAKAQGSRRDTSYQRRAMAEWITDTKHGAGALLARVMVNRIWQGHFGDGLVRTVNDFGKRGDAPTHPDLLEWLATELVRGGWRLKAIHRMILLSAAYRQDSVFDPRSAEIDPENRLLWRRLPRRIESDIYRDTMLAVAGTLNKEMYGKAFKPPIAQEAMQARNVKDPYPGNLKDSPETRRRTVYMFHKRVVQYPLLQVFDGPDASASCGKRNVTTVAPQALAVLNEPFVRLRAGEFAKRLQADVGTDPADQVTRAYWLAIGRKPSPTEMDASVRFVKARTEARSARQDPEDVRLLALTDFAHVMFGLNEFMTID